MIHIDWHQYLTESS